MDTLSFSNLSEVSSTLCQQCHLPVTDQCRSYAKLEIQNAVLRTKLEYAIHEKEDAKNAFSSLLKLLTAEKHTVKHRRDNFLDDLPFKSTLQKKPAVPDADLISFDDDERNGAQYAEQENSVPRSRAPLQVTKSDLSARGNLTESPGSLGSSSLTSSSSLHVESLSSISDFSPSSQKNKAIISNRFEKNSQKQNSEEDSPEVYHINPKAPPKALKSNLFSTHPSNSFRSPYPSFPLFPLWWTPHGLRYTPSCIPTSPILNLHPTLVLTNLPATLTLRELLPKIRGGTVISCILTDTSALTSNPVKGSSSQSALIRFREERAARAYLPARPRCVTSKTEDWAEAGGEVGEGNGKESYKRKSTFSEKKEIHAFATVVSSLVATPAYPLSPRKHRAVYELGHTRCLRIRGFPTRVAEWEFERDVAGYAGSSFSELETLQAVNKGGQKGNGDGGDGNGEEGGKPAEIEARFGSVWAAERAAEVLKTRAVYRGCEVEFSADPCATDLEQAI